MPSIPPLTTASHSSHQGKARPFVLAGLVIAVFLAVPLLNLLVMPAAVSGATLFWVREREALNVTQR